MSMGSDSFLLKYAPPPFFWLLCLYGLKHITHPAFQDGYSLLGAQEVLHWGQALCAYTLALLYLKLPEATLSSFSMQGG